MSIFGDIYLSRAELDRLTYQTLRSIEFYGGTLHSLWVGCLQPLDSCSFSREDWDLVPIGLQILDYRPRLDKCIHCEITSIIVHVHGGPDVPRHLSRHA